MAKIAVITDMDLGGSGYFYLTAPLLSGLTSLGHEIKVAGYGYNGAEHLFPFSIIPARELQECVAIVNNLIYLWQPDILLVAMDLPIQHSLFAQLSQFKKKYIAITPLENGPLTMSWVAPLFNMDAVFFISELGKQEAIKAGLTKAEHLQVGIDRTIWRVPTSEERVQIREGLGISPDEFVILTVADNQERKNLWAGLSAVSRLKRESPKPLRYILVTRENSPVGWKLRDLAIQLDINQELNIFNRGIPLGDLWGLYAVSDAYLCTSKAEGFGMPILEAMACNLPCVATDTGALHELLMDGRGFLIRPEYTFIDVWGNSKRDMIDIEEAKTCLLDLIRWQEEGSPYHPTLATQYVQNRSLEIPIHQLDDKIKELLNAPTQT